MKICKKLFIVGLFTAVGALGSHAQMPVGGPGGPGPVINAPGAPDNPGGPGGPMGPGGPGGPEGPGMPPGGPGGPGPFAPMFAGPAFNSPDWQNQGTITVMACGTDAQGVWRTIPLRVSYTYNGAQYDVTVNSAWNPWTDTWDYGVDVPAFSTDYFLNGRTYDFYVNLSTGTFYFNL